MGEWGRYRGCLPRKKRERGGQKRERGGVCKASAMPAFYRMYYRDYYRLNTRDNYRYLLFAYSSPPFHFSSTLSPSLPLCIIFTSYFYVPPSPPPSPPHTIYLLAFPLPKQWIPVSWDYWYSSSFGLPHLLVLHSGIMSTMTSIHKKLISERRSKLQHVILINNEP